MLRYERDSTVGRGSANWLPNGSYFNRGFSGLGRHSHTPSAHSTSICTQPRVLVHLTWHTTLQFVPSFVFCTGALFLTNNVFKMAMLLTTTTSGRSKMGSTSLFWANCAGWASPYQNTKRFSAVRVLWLLAPNWFRAGDRHLRLGGA